MSQLTAATAECERLATAVAAAVTLERQLRDKRQTAAAEESEGKPWPRNRPKDRIWPKRHHLAGDRLGLI